MKNKANKSYFFYDFVKVTGIIPGYLMMRPKILYYGQKPDVKGPVLVVSNHADLTDPLCILLSFPTRRPVIVATSELYSNKLASFFFSHVHCIKLDKSNVNLSFFREVGDNLRQGKMVAIFPEGFVHEKKDEIDSFKSGAVLIAKRYNVPILPMYIEPRKHWYNRTNIVIGEKINFIQDDCDKSVATLDKLSEQLQKCEIDLMKYCHQGR